MTRWWGVAALALSIGLNAGLVVAVLQQRWQPAMVVVPPAGVPAAGPAIDGWSVAQPFPAAGSGASGAVPAAPGGSGLEAGAEAGVRGGSPADPGGAAAGAAGSPAWPGVGAGAAPPGAAAPEAPPAEPPRLAENRAPGPAVPAREEPPAPPRRDAPPLARLEEMAERLGVPEADRPRLFAVQRRFFTATQEQRVRLDSVRREIRAELLAAAPDRDRIDGLLRQAADLQVGLERAFVDHVLAAREVLDGEAEARYLHFLSQLAPGGPRQRPGIRGPAAPGRRRPGDRPPRRFGPGG